MSGASSSREGAAIGYIEQDFDRPGFAHGLRRGSLRFFATMISWLAEP